ncbi:MAG: Glycerol-3-phosphate ABC transporter, permease protein UgpA [Candidatus Bipolaricaulis sibiricus]|uniref:sn-glycerol-3-phosphate transport system permease protein UgpA n=1 Tax=Bipolaricaulis sibiricus TaxID=2501609 RepID=A0A410FVX9_BIPS1|nr:MAG: Glycerol-3-phosphate ABC transporter, permease protein UgpA [Candidatus Bipolaricaulis sibiricus]
MKGHATFSNKLLPYLLVAPQIVVTGLFFVWPAAQAIYQSLLRSDPFGLHTRFVGLDNFRALFADPYYLGSIRLSFLFSGAVALAAISVSLLLAVMAHKPIRGARVYKTLLIWPYALAPAMAAVLWLFLFQPSIGILAQALQHAGIGWNYTLHGGQALLLVILASVWKQVSYNFIFFLAGLQAIPKSLIEAAKVDGATSRRAFWSVVFPLLAPTTFFLVVMNTVYAFFDTFGAIDALTKGGPGKATETMVYKLYVDGFKNFRLNSSAAQSVILMALVILLTAFQFKFIERRVHYV